MKKSRVSGIRAIQKQQGQLVKIQKSLELLLVQVNESINALKVEELQLKSYAASEVFKNIDENQPSTSAQAVALMSAPSLLDKASEELVTQLDYKLVNQQQINLESLLAPLKCNDNDFEEDDDDGIESEDEDGENYQI
uniref:Uncharacterized protein n=1 Tax=Glossina brevipalpis TaxID=37001 RepID=A0A1A9X1N3_9MUSC